VASSRIRSMIGASGSIGGSSLDSMSGVVPVSRSNARALTHRTEQDYWDQVCAIERSVNDRDTHGCEKTLRILVRRRLINSYRFGQSASNSLVS
jgi:hypothetical protein